MGLKCLLNQRKSHNHLLNILSQYCTSNLNKVRKSLSHKLPYFMPSLPIGRYFLFVFKAVFEKQTLPTQLH